MLHYKFKPITNEFQSYFLISQTHYFLYVIYKTSDLELPNLYELFNTQYHDLSLLSI